MPIHVKSPIKRGDAAPYLSTPVPLPCGYCLKASMTATRSCHPVDSRLRGNDGEGAGMAVIFEGY